MIDLNSRKLDSPIDEPIENLEAYIDALFYENVMPKSKLKSETKRGRRELGSSDTDETSCDIHESITFIKHQLQKLDLLEKLTDEVKELKASVEFNNSLIEALKTDNASLRTEVNKLSQLTGELLQDNVKMAKDILELQCRGMRDNIIVHGLPESNNETHQKSEELVKSFLLDNLKMKPEEAEAIRFSRVHRLGKPKADQGRPRPIVAKLTDSKMKSAVMSKGKELRNSNYSISDQFPAEIMNRRRQLYPIMAEARQNKKNARLYVDKLYIDGQLYRNPTITYWLSCGN